MTFPLEPHLTTASIPGSLPASHSCVFACVGTEEQPINSHSRRTNTHFRQTRCAEMRLGETCQTAAASPDRRLSASHPDRRRHTQIALQQRQSPVDEAVPLPGGCLTWSQGSVRIQCRGERPPPRCQHGERLHDQNREQKQMLGTSGVPYSIRTHARKLEVACAYASHGLQVFVGFVLSM